MLMGLVTLLLAAPSMAMTEEEQAKSLVHAKKAFDQGNCEETILYAAGPALSGGSSASMANYYIALCQDKLSDPASSYKSAMQVDQSKLSHAQKDNLKDLITKLTTYEVQRPFTIALSTGSLAFQNDSAFDKGNFYDVVGSYNSINTSVTLGYEQVAITPLTGTTYKQRHEIIVAEQRFMDAVGVKLGYRLQQANAANVDSSTNMLGALRWFNSSAQLGLTYAQSSYPSYVPGAVNVSQVTLFGSYTLGNPTGIGMFTLDLKGHQISPTSSYDPSVSPYMYYLPSEKQYFSNEFGLRYTKSGVSLAVGGWLGSQIFAVLSDGFVVYSNATTHTGGQKVSLDYYYEDICSFGVAYGVERTKAAGTNVVGSSAVTSVNASFSF